MKEISAKAAAVCQPAAALPLAVLKRRADFLAVARGRKAVTPGFVLQARLRPDPDHGLRVGFTCSKKVGKAVARNRAKRRLREIARLTLPYHGTSGWDYVLIGRAEETARRDFATMLSDLETALGQVHAPARGGGG